MNNHTRPSWLVTGIPPRNARLSRATSRSSVRRAALRRGDDPDRAERLHFGGFRYCRSCRDFVPIDEFTHDWIAGHYVCVCNRVHLPPAARRPFERVRLERLPVPDRSSTPYDSLSALVATLLAARGDAGRPVLSDREREILTSRFGLDGRRPRSLAECAGYFGVSRERVRQVEARAVGKLKARWRAYREEIVDSYGVNL